MNYSCTHMATVGVKGLTGPVKIAPLVENAAEELISLVNVYSTRPKKLHCRRRRHNIIFQTLANSLDPQ